MKASKKLIKYYKGVLLVKILDHLNEDGELMTKEQLDTYLKSFVVIDTSCIEMSMQELQEVIEVGLVFAKELKLKLDYPQDELDELINI
jgi:hypothetical protein